MHERLPRTRSATGTNTGSWTPTPETAQRWVSLEASGTATVDSVQHQFVHHATRTLARSAGNMDAFAAYQAAALTVRDDLIGRWNTTQQTLTALAPKRVYYLSLEFLIGRSFDNALLNLALKPLYTAALGNPWLTQARWASVSRTLSARSRMLRSATAGLGVWQPASWTRWPRSSTLPGATASGTPTASSSSASRTASRLRSPTTGSPSETHGKLSASMLPTTWASAAPCAQPASTGASSTCGSLPRGLLPLPTTTPSQASEPQTQTTSGSGLQSQRRSLTLQSSTRAATNQVSRSSTRPVCVS